MSLAEAKAGYARLIARTPGVDDPRVCQAFAAVPRERYVGPGPWKALREEGYVESPDADPAFLYDDVVIALLPEKRINNGQPTLHARCLSAARVRAGERVLHIGCGTGYYTAVLAELVSAGGEIEAWDIEPELVSRAAENLKERAGVKVALRDAATATIPPRDLIYVCAGCTRPIRAWAEALSEGGRLLFPLTPGWGHGAMLMVTRSAGRFAAELVCRCAFIPSVGASDATEEASIVTAFERDAAISSLHFGPGPPPGGSWLAGNGWWIQ